MLRVAAALVCCLWGAAHAAPPKQKPAPAGYPLEAMKQFVEAIVFEREGNLDEAARHYDQANRASPHANAVFNIARIHLEAEEISDAIRMFEKYLELAPANAGDRAEITALIETLRTTVYPVWIEGRLNLREAVDAILIVDGKVIGKSPMSVKLAPGTYEVARVTANSSSIHRMHVRPGAPANEDLDGDTSSAGNVLITGFPGSGGVYEDGGQKYRLGAAFKLPVGRHSTKLGTRLCTPVEIVVKATTEITHVHIERGTKKDGVGCEPVTRATTQILRPRP